MGAGAAPAKEGERPGVTGGGGREGLETGAGVKAEELGPPDEEEDRADGEGRELRARRELPAGRGERSGGAVEAAPPVEAEELGGRERRG